MARSFNGSSDDIVVASNSVFDIISAISISAWVYPTVTQDGIILCRNNFSQEGYELRCDRSGNGLFSFVILNSSLVLKQADSTTTVSSVLNVWTHLLGTYDGSNVKIYVNGSLQGTTAQFGIINSTAGSSVGIGIDPENGQPFFAGRIAEPLIWNVDLVANEAIALAKGCRATSVRPAFIVGYWPLNGLTSPEPDLSGNVNNGTLTGTAYANHPPIDLSTWTRPSVGAGVTVGVTAVQRRTLSALGTRVGSRQVRV